MFMRYISHEIRTPMNTVFVGLKLIQQDLLELIKPNNHDIDDILININDTKLAAETALEVLNDMLLFDKISQGMRYFNILFIIYSN